MAHARKGKAKDRKALSFREGSEPRKARAIVAERIKETGRDVNNPFAVATAAVKKRMQPAARRALAARRS